jgi:transcriptional regulator with XRE-family HTH domain
MRELADRIKQLRGKLSREEFSEKTGISPRSLANYELGERIPRADTVARICVRMDVSADWLLFGETPSETSVHLTRLREKYSRVIQRNETFRKELLNRIQQSGNISGLLLKIAKPNDLPEIELFLSTMTKYPNVMFRVEKDVSDDDYYEVLDDCTPVEELI